MKPSLLLTVYRVMAYVTAVLLIVLCVAVVGKYGWPDGTDIQRIGETASSTVGIAHGWLYMVYLLVALVLTRMMRVALGPMLLVLLAGTVPFGAFFAERRVVQWFHDWSVRSSRTEGSTEQTGSARS